MSQTVVLTGASGFIAKHILLRLLDRGLAVRATLRTLSRADEVRAAVAPHLPPDALARLSFVGIDLESDAGWHEVMAGADGLIHTASPFPMVQPKDPDALVRPAVEGTRRALAAAAQAGVGRVVLTSSIAAISGTDLPAGRDRYDEALWTDASHPTVTPYILSKTLAERAAWDFAAGHPAMRLTTINPVLVTGPPLDRHYGTSLGVIERILSARDPAVPPIAFGVVDVRDVAEAHVRALERPETAGQRIICHDETLWFADIAQAIKTALPARRIVTRRAPGWVLRLLALRDPSVRTILPALGRFDRIDNARARALLDLSFMPARESVAEAARWIDRNGLA